MAYQIDCGIWSSVFAVPCAVVDEHIKMCSPLSLKILLLMLRHGGKTADAAWLSSQLNISCADISDALNYWVGAGIVRDTARPDDIASSSVDTVGLAPTALMGSANTAHTEPFASSIEPASAKAPTPAGHTFSSGQAAAPASGPVVTQVSDTATGQKIMTIAARPKISRADVAQISKDDPTLGELLREAQSVLGAPLSPVDSEILTALHSYYGFGSDVILMLLQYCVQIGKANMSYVEKVAAAWQERDITTHERAEQEIVRLLQSSENDKKIIRAFGLHGRGLTAREKEYVTRWFALGLDEKLLFLACERTVDNTGKASFAYTDKILESWKTKGIKTIQAAVEDIRSSAGKPATQNRSVQTAGSSIDKDELSELIQKQFLE